MGLLLELVIMVNPQIIVTALVGTTVVFVSLSLTALFAQRGQYLFLGGILMSVLSTMMMISLGNLFFKSYFVNQVQLYVGLAAMAGFILFDTQIIMEKCRMGNKDYIGHSLDLFYDFVTMFRKLLIILTQKECQRDNKKRKEN
jgi:Bax inhibitor 1